MAYKSKAEKEAEAKLKAGEVEQTPTMESELDATTDEELAEQTKKAEEAIKSKNAAKERVYTESDVRQMLAQVMKNKEEGGLDDEDEKEQPKIIRLSRYQDKFIVSLKNMNNDEYNKEVVTAVDILNEKTGKFIPWVTLVYQDGSECLIPIETALKRSVKVNCELVEIVEKDASYDFGKVEVQEVKPDTYKKEGTGQFVKTKVNLKKFTFKVKTPKGEVLTVTPDVVNW